MLQVATACAAMQLLFVSLLTKVQYNKAGIYRLDVQEHGVAGWCRAYMGVTCCYEFGRLKQTSFRFTLLFSVAYFDLESLARKRKGVAKCSRTFHGTVRSAALQTNSAAARVKIVTAS